MQIDTFEVGLDRPIFLIAGPCVIESEELALETSTTLKGIADEVGVPFVYKSSFDKANRSSHLSFRGVGIEQGLRILERVRREVGVPVLTDVHEDTPLDEVADVVSVLQTPAFLCRQTNYIQNVCSQGLPVNIKKGQFLAPGDMRHVVAKAKATGNDEILVCERGASFGYNNLVSDMRSPRDHARHGLARSSSTQRTRCRCREAWATPRAACARWSPCWRGLPSPPAVSGLFMETHPRPDEALSDGPNCWPTGMMAELLRELVAIDGVVKAHAFLEHAEGVRG